MDFSAEREGEDLMLNIIGEGGAGDGSKFLNESGEGMEEERPHESQTNNDYEDGSQKIGPALTKSGKVYILSLC
jgi:hypothetical protein